MFKEQNRVYWYLAGALIMMVALLLFARDILIPFILGLPTSVDPGEFEYRQPPETIIDTSLDYRARFETNYGNFVVDLYERRAPNNVNSLVFLANEGYYSGTKFHRLIPGLLIQGGDRNTVNDNPEDDGFGNPGYLIADEVNWDSLSLSESRRDELRNAGYSSTSGLNSRPLAKYALAMANTRPDSNSNQFFIVLAQDNDSRIESLQGQFTVIGGVVSGRGVLNSIAAVEVDDASAQIPRPLKDIVINNIVILAD